MPDIQQTVNLLSTEDIYLFHEGTNYRSYMMLGAHIAAEEGKKGVRFTVWAPHATYVGLAGNHNGWDGTQEADSFIKIPDSGFWSRFFPGIEPGTFYKYRIISAGGESFLKADPYAFKAEVRPATASVVADLTGYQWGDNLWRRRNKAPYNGPMNIYEMHFGTWKQKDDGEFYTYKEMADLLIPYLVEMSYTHVEFMPLAEHPYDLSWGYQGTGYFAATSRYGEPQELMYLIDQLHQAGIGVILDWVPAHFAKDAHGLRMFDGSPLYEYADPLLAEKPGWGTLSFDFSKPEISSFLISNALFWYDVYHIDGMRVDAVTSMLRLDFEKQSHQYRRNVNGGLENLEAIRFIQQLNKTIFHYYPKALMMAEESSAWPGVTAPAHEGGLGFNYKWNMGWMNDTLGYIEHDFGARPYHHNLLTFPIAYAYSENYTLPLSHDEVVHGKKSLLDKMPGSYEQKFAGLRLLLGYQISHPGKKLLFMGGEFGQFIEWKDQEQLDWLLMDYEAHRRMLAYTAALNKLYVTEKALWELDHDLEGYQWIYADDNHQSVLSYIRRGKKPVDTLVFIINFQPVERKNYRIGVPRPGTYEEIFSSESVEFGGSGYHNGPLKSSKKEWHNQVNSLELTIPPLSFLVLKKAGRKPKAVVE
ncbi:MULTISPECIES: 1,4-alpha-glucan branching protein GlgB [unclassified Paenibacillus]|uniref:1,4-alpha-glucan branching protein GlgB n=1 Tax=unclassified Paenibacillus TaxID=185978 RepID=UPI002406C1B1|nr:MULTISPECIES: 1,4-alpha-glucan branching protein GlgB [unclassified Paenibacillus]MDF9841113.1 1,4-alpha-glucan branching enzyme [Paenibacillus sp. PastF-2]MDF9847715.1 1,4-alpha-glucan branching enzyme [Paenibacillus sp. PastM-2]MDF9854284.1 1,4-alpha-glucan branching enzyme [Paenibacillus sp. PastF-1]MDH6479545.1 1,4-alpha-glucan branching enzyme [Paenibacillus sp. PastH-2]MDH6505210.1 1,4-alpha-glucan branching enzyme [Paenibacillus sp. PastM-3]